MREIVSPLDGFLSPFGVSGSGGAPAFDPATLFAGGERGAWYAAGPSTCFTDTARTLAAAADDQMGGMTDLSGNGSHQSQANISKQPYLRQTVGGKYFVESDGLDDFMASPVFSPVIAQAGTVAVAAKLRSANGAICGASNTSFRWLIFGNSGTLAIFAGAILNSSQSAPTDAVVMIADFNGASSQLEYNGSSVASGNAGAHSLINIELFAQASGTSGIGAVDFYGGIWLDRALTAPERAGVISYLGSLL